MAQKELANLIGLSRQTVNPVESDKYLPALEEAFRIALVIGMSIEIVLFYESDFEGEQEFADGVVVDVLWNRLILTAGINDGRRVTTKRAAL